MSPNPILKYFVRQHCFYNKVDSISLKVFDFLLLCATLTWLFLATVHRQNKIATKIAFVQPTNLPYTRNFCTSTSVTFYMCGQAVLFFDCFVAERSAASSAAAVGRGRCHKLPLSSIPGIRCNVQVGGSSRLTDFGPIDGPQEWDTNTTASRRSNRYGHISICLLLECFFPLKRNWPTFHIIGLVLHKRT